METIKRKQRLLSAMAGLDGKAYYSGPIDGIDGDETREAARRFAADYGLATSPVSDSDTTDMPGWDNVLVFSRAIDGNRYLTKNFRVKEFACQDGSDPIFIHPQIPTWCQLVRDTFGYPFTPNSAYRTVSHNAKPEVGGSARSLHLYGKAVDIPAKGSTTPQMLYDFFDALLGNSGELGIYAWGVHVAVSEKKNRFRG